MDHKTKDGCKSQKLKRNERERKRVNEVNVGFDELRERVPLVAHKKKLSKVETLREAVNYIKHLNNILQGQRSTSMLPPVANTFDDYKYPVYKQQSPNVQFEDYSTNFHYSQTYSSENSFSDSTMYSSPMQ